MCLYIIGRTHNRATRKKGREISYKDRVGRNFTVFPVFFVRFCDLLRLWRSLVEFVEFALRQSAMLLPMCPKLRLKTTLIKGFQASQVERNLIA